MAEDDDLSLDPDVPWVVLSRKDRLSKLDGLLENVRERQRDMRSTVPESRRKLREVAEAS